jgi:hypothetical protein
MKTEEEIKRRIQFLENGIIYAETYLDSISRTYVKLENETKLDMLKWVLEERKNG